MMALRRGGVKDSQDARSTEQLISPKK